MTTDIQRIESILSHLRVSKNKLGISIGDKNGMRFQNVLSGRNNISEKLANDLTAIYPEFNYDWILTGKGQMLNEHVIQIGEITKAGNTAFHPDEKGLIPFYDVDFMAGQTDGFAMDSGVHPAYFMDIPEFRGCTAFRAYSDSMETLINSGAILFGVKINWESHLEFGQVYGITMRDGVRRYLKKIRRHPKKSETHFLLKSENREYDPMDLPKSEIKNIWLINGWINKRT